MGKKWTEWKIWIKCLMININNRRVKQLLGMQYKCERKGWMDARQLIHISNQNPEPKWNYCIIVFGTITRVCVLRFLAPMAPRLSDICLFWCFWPNERNGWSARSTMAEQRDGNKSIMIMLDININIWTDIRHRMKRTWSAQSDRDQRGSDHIEV